MGKKGKTGKGRLDKFYHLAKEQGYRSRAAFKLIHLNKKYNFLSKSKVLIDLCAAPGGWLQIASKYMPLQSIILGIDLVPIKPIPRCISFAEDITSDKCRSLIRGQLKTWKADVVLHDGAPNVGAAWVQDAFSQSELVLCALKLATEFLAKGGWFISKVFRSKDYNALMWVFHQLFESVEATKPPSSRDVSAEIFVVCQGFKAPKLIDPKFLDPRYVFKDLDDQAITSITSVFLPENKKRHRDGYGDEEHVLFHTSSATEFLMSEDPIGILSSNHQITFETTDDASLKSNSCTSDEILYCCQDLKVLSKKDYKTLLKWRTSIRLERGIDKPKGLVIPTPDPLLEMTEDERITLELDRALHQQGTLQKRTKRKDGERRAKEIMRLQMNMMTPSDLASDHVKTDDTLFHASLTTPQATTMLGMELETNDQLTQYGMDLSKAGIVISDDEVVTEQDVAPIPLTGRAALFYASNPMLQALVSQTANTPSQHTNGTADVDHVDHLDALNADLNAQQLAHVPKRKRGNTGLSLDDDVPLKKKSGLVKTKREVAKAKKAAIHAIDLSKTSVDDEDNEDEDLELDPEIQASTRARALAVSESESGSEDEDEPQSDANSENIMDDVDMHTTGAPAKGLTTAHALALGYMVHQNKEGMIDASFNRYAYGVDDGIPLWFADDERKYNKPIMPISKETVLAIEKRRQALDARPIKKIAEAKFRKKKRLVSKIQRQISRATAIADNDDLTESSKAKAISKLMAKKIHTQTRKPTVVVARGANRGVKGRPSGVQGRYLIVDPRMRKELRAKKRLVSSGKRKSAKS